MNLTSPQQTRQQSQFLPLRVGYWSTLEIKIKSSVLFWANHLLVNKSLLMTLLIEAARCCEIWLKEDLIKATNRLHAFKPQ
ncbi:unnamed protein product [Ranitomeya imitator]|uniref:Uncharacterized protein n=1 Tax=Ranitomeya imitator TaxID=111125 RepID=A0ABN9LR49_9NEOB|nr:unnamed protein product [Ranitomeya imitator]